MKTAAPKQSKLRLLARLPDTRLFINGQWCPAANGETFETQDPATEEKLAEVHEAREEDIDNAVLAARRAFDSGPWPRMKAKERAGILMKVATGIREDLDNLALLETQDSGKPISNTRQGDIPASADAFDYYAGWADKLTGETIPADPNFFSYTLREPLGVIAAITPWNFPLLLAAQKVAPALAAGNTVVLKPAEQTPLSALLLAELCADAGIPAGVLNVVPGYGPIAGAALVRHPDVDGISFTGEYRTGQEIMKTAAPTLKRLSFELGGKSANIVFADADLDKAAAFACEGIFFNQGEVCCSGSRLFVEDRIRKTFLKVLLEKSRKWVPGDPMDPKTEMGAIISREQFQKIQSAIRQGEKEGASLVLDGRNTYTSPSKKGFFIGPTIFEQVRPDMRIAQEEIFGPVLAQIAFQQFDDVIRQANQTFYGLAAAVWTRDLEKAHRAARLLKAGTVWVNHYGAVDHAVPFGGYKMSGAGREGGKAPFDFYTQLKAVWIRC